MHRRDGILINPWRKNYCDKQLEDYFIFCSIIFSFFVHYFCCIPSVSFQCSLDLNGKILIVTFNPVYMNLTQCFIQVF